MKKALPCASVVGALLMAAAGLAQAPAEGSVALLPLLGRDLAVDDLLVVDKALRLALERQLGGRLQPAADTAARFAAAAARGLRCDRRQVECLLQIGVIVGADVVLIGAVSLDPSEKDGLDLELRHVDVAAGAEARRATAPARPSSLDADLDHLVAALALPEATRAALSLQGVPPGASVTLDGVPRPDAASAPVDVTPGPHRVDVQLAGRPPLLVDVDARRGEVTTVAVVVPLPPAALQASPPPPADRTLPLALFAAGGAAAGVGLVVMGVGAVPRLAYAAEAQELTSIEQRIGADRAALEKARDEITITRARLDGDAVAWTDWGLPAVLTGVALAAAGVGALAVTGVVVLTAEE